MPPAAPPSCQQCRNAPAAVVVADDDLTERVLCDPCWHRLTRHMRLTVVRFAGPYGRSIG